MCELGWCVRVGMTGTCSRVYFEWSACVSTCVSFLVGVYAVLVRVSVSVSVSVSVLLSACVVLYVSFLS